MAYGIRVYHEHIYPSLAHLSLRFFYMVCGIRVYHEHIYPSLAHLSLRFFYMVYGIRVYHEHIYDIRYYSYDYLSLILHYYSYDCIHARMQVREKVAISTSMTLGCIMSTCVYD